MYNNTEYNNDINNDNVITVSLLCFLSSLWLLLQNLTAAQYATFNLCFYTNYDLIF